MPLKSWFYGGYQLERLVEGLCTITLLLRKRENFIMNTKESKIKELEVRRYIRLKGFLAYGIEKIDAVEQKIIL